MFIEEAIQELSIILGVSPIIPGVVLILSMAGMVGILTSRVVGTRFGMILGLGPIVFGVYIGILPVWIAILLTLPGAFLIFSSLFRASEVVGGGDEGEEEEVEISDTTEVPGPPLLESKPRYKPPWSK